MDKGAEGWVANASIIFDRFCIFINLDLTAPEELRWEGFILLEFIVELAFVVP